MLRATCQCGEATATALKAPDFVIACNCIACQRRTGGPIGVGGYFGLRFEPDVTHYAILSVVFAALGVVLLRIRPELRPLPTGLCLILLGIFLAGARAHMVKEPVLGFRYYGPIEGRIVAIDRSVSDKIRLTLDQVVLSGIAVEKLPTRVRVALHGDMYFTPEPGLRIMLSGQI